MRTRLTFLPKSTKTNTDKHAIDEQLRRQLIMEMCDA